MIIHRVTQGQTLGSIAEMYGIPVSRLVSDNGLNDENMLVVGQELVILYPQETYTVRRGDSLYGVANQYGTTVKSLLRNNPQLDGIPVIYPDQELTITYSGEQGRNIIVNGYAYPFINEDDLRKVLPYLTYLTVFTYGFTLDGNLIEPDDEKILSIASGYDVGTILLISTLEENGNFNNELSRKLFADEELQDRVIENIVNTAKMKGYNGVEVDFEYIRYEDRENYVNFLKKLSESLSGEGILLFVALAPKTSDDQEGLLYEGHDYREIGEVADYVILMTYEWGYQYGEPGAVAPLKNVEAVVNYAVSEIPENKILLGIPNYGYDWKLPYVAGSTMAQGISNTGAVDLARDVGAQIEFSNESNAPFFGYTADGAEHIVWFENAQSITGKLELINRYDLAGASIWNVMKYFPQLYLVLNSMYNVTDLNF